MASAATVEGVGLKVGLATVMPEQFEDIWHRRALPPEAQLQAAILEQAVQDLRRPQTDRRGQRSHREALGWLLSDNEGWPFSFMNVCASLGIDAAALRSRLLGETGDMVRRPSALNGSEGTAH